MEEPVPPPAPVLTGDPRGYPAPPRSSNKAVIGIAIGGCAFVFLAFIAFVAVIGWIGYRAEQRDRARGGGKPGVERDGGKPVAGLDGGRSSDPATWIGAGDYPPDALARGEEGTVAIAWEVSPDGLPLRCTIETTSGHPSLDTAACAAIMRHARYDPLPAGAVSVRRETRRVVWRLPASGGGGK